MNDTEKRNFIQVNLVLITSLGTSILLNSYATALYLGNFSQQTLPYYFIVSSFITALSMIFLMPYIEGVNKKHLLLTQGGSALFIILFLIISLWPNRAVALIYTFLLGIIANINTANSWSIAAAAFEFRVYKMYVNQFLLLSSLGCVLISGLTYAGVNYIGYNFLLVLSLLLMVGYCLALNKIQIIQFKFQPKMTSTSLRTYPLFMILTAYLALTNILSVFGNYQMMFRLGQSMNFDQISKFMTLFYLFVNLGGILTQGLAKKMLEDFGIAMLFVGSALIIFLFLIPSIFSPNLYWVSLFYGIVLIFYTSVIGLGRQVTLNALPSMVKNKAQVIVKTVTNNLARMIGAIILLIFAYHFAFYSYQILSVLSLVAMLILGLKIKKHYGETLLLSIKEKRFYLPLIVDDDSYHSLANPELDNMPLVFKGCLHATTHNYKQLIRLFCQFSAPQTERYLEKYMGISPLLASVEFAKQIAIRATHIPLSEDFKKKLLKHIERVIKELNHYNYLVQHEESPNKRFEFTLRRQLVEKKLICYLATVIAPKRVMEILPKLSSKFESEKLQMDHAIALEYLDWLIEDRHLAQKVLATIEHRLISSPWDPDDFKDDSWTKTLLQYDESEAIAMETTEKVFALRKSAIYATIPAELLLAVAQEYTLVEYSAGEKIYSVGDYPNDIYLLLKGRVVMKRGGIIERYAEENDFIGLLIIMSNQESPVDVEVVENSTLLKMSRTTFEQLTDDYPDILREIVKYIIKIYGKVVAK